MKAAAAALGVLAFAATGLVALPSAHADDSSKKEAQTLFTQGLKLAESGDSTGALASFRQAYEKFPNFRVLYNIGQLCQRLNDPACTVRSYEQYLRDGGADVPAKRRTEVTTELQKLSKTVGTLNITVSVPNAEVSIDDVVVGRSPLPGNVAVNAGPHKVIAVYEGKTAERSLDVGAGETTPVDLQLPKDAPAAEPAAIPDKPEAPPPKPPPPKKEGFPVVPWAVTGGLAALTLVSGIIAIVSYGSFTDTKETFPVTKAELDDLQGTARTWFLVTSILGAGTLVSAGVATYLTLSSPSKKAQITVGLLGVRGTFP